jgi:adenosylmethionine-8-amino-7-oxononanoate aminotransferase
LGDSILFVPPISIQADEVKHLVRAVRLAMDETLPPILDTPYSILSS